MYLLLLEDWTLQKLDFNNRATLHAGTMLNTTGSWKDMYRGPHNSGKAACP